MTDVEIDPHVYFPELGELRDAVSAGRWQPVEAYLEHWRGRDPDRVHAAAWTTAEAPGADACLTAQAATPLVLSVTAALRIKEGWDIRTRAPASAVSEEQWVGFRAKLVEAERDLIKLAAVDPSDVLVAGLRLVTSRGLGLGLSEAQRRYARVATLAPDHIAAQAAHLQNLAPKWFGTTDLMFEFARHALTAGRPGSSAGRLVPLAHYEHWLSLPVEQSGPYIESAGVHEEIAAAADASVFHPDYDPALRWVTDHSWFASVHCIGGRIDLARRHFAALGRFADLEAWRCFDDPRAELERDREQSIAAGTARA